MKKENKELNNEEASLVEKNYKKRKSKSTKIIISVLLSIILIYFLYVIYLLIKQPTDVFTIDEGKLYLEETDIGYVIRDEVVVKGDNYKNGMEQIKNEGEKAGNQEIIFRYFSKNEEELKKQIQDLDVKIQETMKGQTDLYYSDVKLLEDQLDEQLEQINTITDISKLTEYEKQINTLITKKAKIVGDKSASGSYLKELNNQRVQLEKQLNDGAETIRAPRSGIVSYKVDGLEETLTPNSFSALNKDYLQNLDLKTGKLIATSDECGKIINNFEAYIATVSNTKQAKEAQIGNTVKLRLSNQVEIDAEIVYTAPQDEEDTLLVLKIDKEIEELSNYRKISFDLIWWNYSGLKVPNQSILEKDGLHYVIRNRAGYRSEILVNVKKQNDKYSIITNYTTDELKELGFTSEQITEMKNISIYDEILLDPNSNK